MNTRVLGTTLGLAAILLAAGGAMALTIETVPVGNVGNTDDVGGTPYGRVAYEYRIGKYEVTAGQYAEFLNAVAATDTYGLYNASMDSDSLGCQITQNGSSGSYTYDFSDRPIGTTEADWTDRPVNYVSWGDAARFANWLHNGQPTGAQNTSTTEDGAYFLDGAVTRAALLAVNREADWTWAIPTEDEWYKAAYHKNDGDSNNYFDYPTSNDSTPGRDITETTNPGNNGNYQDYDSNYLIGSPYYRTEVGEFEESNSPYDTFDQGGNVFEWNEAIRSYATRILRGGSFHHDGIYLHASRRINYPATDEYPGTGFRVSQVPEPASASLLLLGVMALLRRRKK